MLDVTRFGKNKKIDLISFLPDNYANTEVETFLKFFQNYLNTLYTNVCDNDGFIINESTPNLSASEISYLPGSLSGNIFDVTGNSLWQKNSNVIKGYPDIYDNVKKCDWIKKDGDPTWYAVKSVDNDVETQSLSGAFSSAFSSAYSTGLTSGVVDYAHIILDDIYRGNTEYSEFKLLKTNKHISILEKIKRITETHNTELIDVEYLQYFANELGYPINISKNEMSMANSDSNDEINRYIRFVVQNLPNWYKIKTTENAVKVILYSFGLIVDLIYYYTNDYSEWDNYIKVDKDGNPKDLLKTTNDKSFLTSHFGVFIKLDNVYNPTENDLLNSEKYKNIINVIDTIRPINTVFRGLSGYINRKLPFNFGMTNTLKYFETINL